jgi:hypothetical protein
MIVRFCYGSKVFLNTCTFSNRRKLNSFGVVRPHYETRMLKLLVRTAKDGSLD